MSDGIVQGELSGVNIELRVTYQDDRGTEKTMTGVYDMFVSLNDTLGDMTSWCDINLDHNMIFDWIGQEETLILPNGDPVLLDMI